MPRIGRLLAGFAFLACCLLSSNAWSYGWLGHWRVAESQWIPLSKNVCASVGLSGDLPADKLLDEEVAYLAGLGAIFSDIGYLPGFPRRFSDLVHYIGAGTFTDNLTQAVCEDKDDSRDPRMLAFAAGFRSHYATDIAGHYVGTNRAVAKISAKGHAGQERVVFEDDVATHKAVELGAFSVADLKYGTVRIATRFIGLAGRETLVNRVIEVVRKALIRTYGEDAAAAAPTPQHILMYTLYVARRVCETTGMVFGEKLDAPDDKGSLEVFNACKKKGTIAFTLPKPDTDTLPLIARGIAFIKSVPDIYRFYNESIVEVEKRLSLAGKRTLRNYNLDTGLPSASGQYRLADAIYASLGSVKPAKCDLLPFEKAAKGEFVDWREYQKIGLCVGQAVRPVQPAVGCTELLNRGELALVRQGWLRQIDPSTGNAPTRRSVQIMGVPFVSDAAGNAVAGSPADLVKFLYACHAMRSSSTQHSEIEHRAFEANDRLRPGDRIDPSTGLYK